MTTIDAGGGSRVLGIQSGTTATLTGLTLTGGVAFGGAGIDNAGTLTLTDSTVAGNSADLSGGGIDNEGTTAITNSLISQNKAGQDAGGLINNGLLTATGVHFAHNVAGRNGGALYINAGTAVIVDSIFSGNKTEKKTGLGTSIYCAVDGAFDIDDETVISQNGVSIFKELELELEL